MVLREGFLKRRRLRESREMPQLGAQLGTRAQEHQQHGVLQNDTPRLQATEFSRYLPLGQSFIVVSVFFVKYLEHKYIERCHTELLVHK